MSVTLLTPRVAAGSGMIYSQSFETFGWDPAGTVADPDDVRLSHGEYESVFRPDYVPRGDGAVCGEHRVRTVRLQSPMESGGTSSGTRDQRVHRAGHHVKYGDDRLVVPNDVAKHIIESRRGKHPTHVFSYNGAPVKRMLNSAWCRARNRVRLQDVRVHDLEHTFCRRLRAALVGLEDRQDLSGHRSGRITTRYSAAELSRPIEAANKVCARDETKPRLAVRRRISAA